MKFILKYNLLTTARISTSGNLNVASVWNKMSSINKIHAEEYVSSVIVRWLPDSRHGESCFDHEVNKEFHCLTQQRLQFQFA